MIDDLGFTGTQRGMTTAQVRTVRTLLQRYRPRRLHHGDCVGADEKMHDLTRVLSPTTEIHVHPSVDATRRAWCRGDVIAPPKPPLERDADIALVCAHLLATPGEAKERLRSGTWTTIRRARKRGRPITIVWPDGTIAEEGPCLPSS